MDKDLLFWVVILIIAIIILTCSVTLFYHVLIQYLSGSISSPPPYSA